MFRLKGKKLPLNEKLVPRPVVVKPIGGIHEPLPTGNVLIKPVSTVLVKPTEKPVSLFN